MRKISVFMSVTLDGVGQGLGRPEEDTRNGFRHDGWGQRSSFTWHMNSATKYVVSTTLEDVGAWQHSVLLRGDATQAVAELKATPGSDLSIIGSASLVRTLPAAGLIDHYTLLIHPLTLGSGARLIPEAAQLTAFALTGTVVTARYGPRYARDAPPEVRDVGHRWANETSCYGGENRRAPVRSRSGATPPTMRTRSRKGTSWTR